MYAVIFWRIGGSYDAAWELMSVFELYCSFLTPELDADWSSSHVLKMYHSFIMRIWQVFIVAALVTVWWDVSTICRTQKLVTRFKV